MKIWPGNDFGSDRSIIAEIAIFAALTFFLVGLFVVARIALK